MDFKTGLDIFLYEVNSRCSVTFTLSNNAINRSELGLFEKFNADTTNIDVEYYSFTECFKTKQLEAEDYKWVMQDEKGYHFECNDTKDIIIFDYDTLENFTYIEKEKCLYAKEIAYQRKGVTTDFYDKFYGNCRCVSNNSNIKIDLTNIFIHNNEVLKIAQQYCEDGYPFKNWYLKDNQFIHFSA